MLHCIFVVFLDATNLCSRLLRREAQEKKFDTEKANLIKYYDTELDQLYRQQKQQIEKAEGSQDADMRMTAKKIKADQVSVRPRSLAFT